MPTKKYFAERWENLRPLIKELYLEAGKELHEIQAELKKDGIIVPQRKIRTWLISWGLHRNYKGTTYSVTRPKNRPQPILPLPSARTQPTRCLNVPIQQFYDQAVSCMQDYCIFYVSSEKPGKDFEPQIHRKTPHGVFGEKIAENLAHWRHNNFDEAFRNLSDAFITLEAVLRNHHPMSLALLMTVICEVSRWKVTGLQAAIFSHSKNLMKLSDTQHPWIGIFDALEKIPPSATQDISLRCLRMARDKMSSGLTRTDWKTLYLEERLCDGLYHAGITEERFQTRKNLLLDQELHYGLYARNVLWTLTNVAKDKAQLGTFNDAEADYWESLRRAEIFEGFDRAKTRFAALEGLADVQLAKVGLLSWPYETWFLKRQVTVDDREALQGAWLYLKDSELEAQTWFEATSRRTARVREKMGVLCASMLYMTF